MKKILYFLVCIGTLSMLGGCAVQVVNLGPPQTPETAVATAGQISSAAAEANQSDIAALAAQTQQVLLVERDAYRLQQLTYMEQKKSGTNFVYTTAKRDRLLKAIPIDWKLAEQATQLYRTAERARPELAGEGMAVAKAVLVAADARDVSDQFTLTYTISGLESNTDYLGHKDEAVFNTLAQKRVVASKKADSLMRQFLMSLKKAQTSGGMGPSTFSVPTENANNPVKVTVTGNPNKNDRAMLYVDMEKEIAKTSLSTSAKKVSISLNVDGFTFETHALKKTAEFLLLGYMSMGGRQALFSASAQEAGGISIPLPVNSYEISAKDNTILATLITLRTVGRAEMAILETELK